MQNPAVTGEAFAQMQVPQLIIGFIRKVAGALFANLPLFFAVASAIGLAKAEKPTAAFAAVIGYMVMNVGISATLAGKGITAATTTPAALQQAGMDQTAAMMISAEYINMLGVFSYNMSVLDGVIGGMAVVNGETTVGALNIFNASLTHPGSIPDETLRTATQFLAQGKIPMMMFGLPAAALAVYHTARPEYNQRLKALVMAGALTSFSRVIAR